KTACAVLVNLGTPSTEQLAAMDEAIEAANQANTPWVLDPVAVGALPVRTRYAQRIVSLRPALIRGNASEIMALAGHRSTG
ncbi:hydroxyethylthiazole kinase, partial [Glutamicibacter creatinolyticus]